MAQTATSWIKQFDLEKRRPPFFFRNLEELDLLQPPHPQAHAIRRAWQEMDLDGVVCFDNAPVIYFRRLDAVDDDDEVKRLHRQVWNQGIAPLLVLIGERQVQVYSGLATPATEREAAKAEGRLVELMNRTAEALELESFIRRVELGEVFREHSRCFDPKRRVDRHLLDNLERARDRLHNASEPHLPYQTIHAVLGRVIFTCYLVDREVINAEYFDTAGAKGCSNLLDLLTKYPATVARKKLYDLFTQLRQDFHGDLFDADLAAESRLLTYKHIDVLKRFLADEEMSSGQMSLGFSAYDFAFIPIETISAIYERFLDAEDPSGRRETGVYYTPRFLAEIALDTALKGVGSLLGKRFLDPSCGSGIFLVGLFNRLAEEWRGHHPKASNDQRAAALIKLLQESIYGVDRSETACQVAALSLYLALLDQLAPRVIRELQKKGRALPHLVCRGPRATSEKDGSNIFYSDFFDEQLKLPGDFDVLVGNPPWARATGVETLAEAWCVTKSVPIAQRQIAYAFMWKAGFHLKENAHACFVLPAATLFNHHVRALDFQKQWLSSSTVDLILNLSDLCFYLFDGAKRPAMIARYRPGVPSKDARVSYVVPKTEYETIRAEILTISDLDRMDVSLSEILSDLGRSEVPLVWKQSMWATPRGRKFLGRLNDYPTLDDRIAKSVKANMPWEMGEGFNVLGKGKARDREILHELPFLPTKAVDRYVISPTMLLPRPRAFDPRYMGKEVIFRAPHVIFPHGVSRLGERMKAVYVGFDCSFEHGLRGIHGSPQDEDELRFLTCAFCSPLFLYFFFHTAANWGTERAKVHVEEYGRFPYPRADTKERRRIIKEIVTIHRRLETAAQRDSFFSPTATEAHHLLDNLVYEYYEVDVMEKALIEDTVNIWIRSATPARGRQDIPSLEPSTPTQRGQYMRVLIDALTGWISRQGVGITAKPIISSDVDFGVLCLSVTESLERQVEMETISSKLLDQTLHDLKGLLPSQSGAIRQMRDLKVFDGNDLYILKPLARRYWSDTAALNDADEIVMAILRSAEGE